MATIVSLQRSTTTTSESLNKMRSQKAKGTSLLAKLALPGFQAWTFELIQKPEDITQNIIDTFVFKGYDGQNIAKAFARPCPVSPRHGFVDSRAITTIEELTALWEETLAADPDAEIMVGSSIDAVCSGILTGDGTLIVGKGNDGATGGHDSRTYSVCAPRSMPKIFEIAGVRTNPYYEIVAGASYCYLVQMRDGPLLPSGAIDFIPRQLTVEHVVVPHTDLLKWESDVKEFAPGTVVWGKGHGLGSHAAVHCVINNVPFIVSHEPQVGDLIEASEAKPTALLDADIQRGSGIAAAFKGKDHEGVNNIVKLGVGLLHNWARLQYSDSAGTVLGITLGSILRGTAMAVVGEMRHHRHSGRHKTLKTLRKQERYEIYEHLDIFAKALPDTLELACKEFNSKSFGFGYGGPLWANAAVSSLDLMAAISQKDWMEALGICNRIVNMSHNGGYLLNKFVEDSSLNEAAFNPGFFLASCIKTLFAVQEIALASAASKTKTLKPVKIKRHAHQVALDTDNVVGADETWKGKLPTKDSIFFGRFKSMYGIENWTPFKVKGGTLSFSDKKNNIVWEIV